MFIDEVVKVSTDELCRVVNEKRKDSFDGAEVLGRLFSKGQKDILDLDIFKNTYHLFRGEVNLLKAADIIDEDEAEEILYNFKVGLGNRFIEGLLKEEGCWNIKKGECR